MDQTPGQHRRSLRPASTRFRQLDGESRGVIGIRKKVRMLLHEARTKAEVRLIERRDVALVGVEERNRGGSGYA